MAERPGTDEPSGGLDHQHAAIVSPADVSRESSTDSATRMFDSETGNNGPRGDNGGDGNGSGNHGHKPPRTTGGRIFRGLMWLVVILLVLMLAVVIFVATFDWNRAKPFINNKVSKELGRPFAINGDLSVKWRRPPDAPGWRGWLPWPHVSAHDITLANADWARTKEMVSVAAVDFDVAVPPLLIREVSIPSVALRQPQVDIERMHDGRNNYTFKTSSSGGAQSSAWKVALRDITFSTGTITVLDEDRKADLTLTLDTLGNPIPFGEMLKQQEETSRRESSETLGRNGAAKFSKAAAANEASQASAASAASASSAASDAREASRTTNRGVVAASATAPGDGAADAAKDVAMAASEAGADAASSGASARSTASKASSGREGTSLSASSVTAAKGVSPTAGAVPAVTPVSPYRLGWTMKGKYNNSPVSGTGKLGEVLSLQDATRPFPLQADVKIGDTRIALVGTLTDPMHLAALDWRLWFQGQSLSHLYSLTGIALPDSPPFATEGRLIGAFKPAGNVFRYQDFTGRVGGSDLNGTLVYEGITPRPKLSGNLVSHLLQFSDLAPLIGADSNAEKAKRGDVDRQPSNKALPVEAFRTDRWKSIDADVTFAGKRIIRDASLPITDLYTHVMLSNGRLQLVPLRFGVAGGDLTADIDLDGGKEPLQARVSMGARHVKLKQLFPTSKTMQSALGEINGDAALSATGNSPARLAATSNGEIKLLVQHGAVSAFLMEAAGLNVANAVIERLFGNRDVQINCAASDFVVDNGVLNSKVFVVDTQDAVIDVDGTIDLRTEGMDLGIHPHTKGFRIFSLRSPLYVKGTFKDPHIGVDALPLAARGAAAVGLGLLNPFAALIPLLAPSHHEEAPCAQLFKALQEKPMAPPPGKKVSPKAGAAAARAMQLEKAK